MSAEITRCVAALCAAWSAGPRDCGQLRMGRQMASCSMGQGWEWSGKGRWADAGRRAGRDPGLGRRLGYYCRGRSAVGRAAEPERGAGGGGPVPAASGLRSRL